MFFVLSNAIFDAGIAAWDAKRTYDSVRPITAIPLLNKGKAIRAWVGPRARVRSRWMERSGYLPGGDLPHACVSRLRFWTQHSQRRGGADSSAVDRQRPVWRFGDFVGREFEDRTGSDSAQGSDAAMEYVHRAANEAGMSGRYGGIHFRGADLAGRLVGRMVALQAVGESSDLVRWHGTPCWRPKYRKTNERNPVRGTGSAVVLTSLSFVWEIVPCASG